MAPRISDNTGVPQRPIPSGSQNLLSVFAVVPDALNRRVMPCSELQQSRHGGVGIKDPLLKDDVLEGSTRRAGMSLP